MTFLAIVQFPKEVYIASCHLHYRLAERFLGQGKDYSANVNLDILIVVVFNHSEVLVGGTRAGWLWRVQWWGEKVGEGVQLSEVCYDLGWPLPEIKRFQGGGMGGAVEEMAYGVVARTTIRARGVRGRAYAVLETEEPDTMTRPQLG